MSNKNLPKPISKAPEAEIPAAKTKKIEKYYRLRKLNGFLAEIVEVEVDENAVVVSPVTKQDSPVVLLDRIQEFIMPTSDQIAKRKRLAAQAEKAKEKK